ncbi:MAG: VCBS repeat-containing protein [Oligoflexia bacterium]|nr:VCBS repeat-containing protein [Oligoflexia bacterium]
MTSKKVLIFILALLLSSCSSKHNKPKSSQSSKSKTAAKPVAPKPAAPKPTFGPTTPNEKAFADATEKMGLDGISGTHFYSVDWSGDGYTDLVYLPLHYSVPKFLKYSPKYQKFLPIKYNPFGKVIRGSYLVFVDLNKDSVLDVIVGTLNQKTELEKEPIRIFKGSHKPHYDLQEMSTGIKVASASSSIIPFDYDLDGNLDLFVTSWYDFTESPLRPKLLPDKILKGDGNFKFQNVSYLLTDENKFRKSTGKYTNAVASFGASICDVDQNGFPDILSASSAGMANRLWMNLYDRKHKDRVFKNYAKEANLEADDEGQFDAKGGGNSFYLNCSDYNDDKLIDIAVGELFHSYDNEQRDRSSILTGSQFAFPPKFIRTEYHKDDGSGSWSQGDRRASWVDLDSDGYLDLIVDNSGFPPKSRLIYFKQESDRSFADQAEAFGINFTNPSGTVITDFNRDGYADIISGQTNVRESEIKPRIFAFENQAKNKRRFRVILRGIKSNYHGIGATIKVTTSKRTITRVVQSVAGNLPSQNEEGEFITLFKDEDIAKIKVTWPYLTLNTPEKREVYTKTYIKSLRPFVGKNLIVLCENGRVYGDRVKSCNE